MDEACFFLLSSVALLFLFSFSSLESVAIYMCNNANFSSQTIVISLLLESNCVLFNPYRFIINDKSISKFANLSIRFALVIMCF